MHANLLIRDATKIAEMRERVYGYMLYTRREKYEGWIRGIKRYKKWVLAAERWLVPLGVEYFRDAALRLEMIECVYAALRCKDDIADGDAPLPARFCSRTAYAEAMMHFVRTGRKHHELSEELLAHAFDVAKELDMHIKPFVLDMLESLLFDAVRSESPELVIFDQEQLDRSSGLLDIIGTGGGGLLALGEPLTALDTIEPLGQANRIAYNIRDLDEDMRSNQCNISREDIETFGILDPRDTHSPEVRRWKCKEAARGLLLLEKYRWSVPTAGLHPITRIIFWLVYDRPTERSLERALTENLD